MRSAADLALWLASDRLRYHEAQHHTPYRSTVHLAEFLSGLPDVANGDALDVPCGACGVMTYLGPRFPGLRWTGIDIAGKSLFGIARAALDRVCVAAELLTGDFYQLAHAVGGRQFDLVLCTQTLFCLPDFEPLVEQLCAVARRWVVITSLFTDWNIDVKIEATDYTLPPGVQGPFRYNVLSLPRFLTWCAGRGWDQHVVRDFEIDVDLPAPPARGLGTHTIRTADGGRLQASGPILLPWKFVALRRSAP